MSKYISEYAITKACEDLPKTTGPFWGILALLVSLKSEVKSNFSYAINTLPVKRFLTNLFYFGDEQCPDSDSLIYAVFSKHWISELKNIFPKSDNRPNFYNIIVWSLRREEFKDNANLNDLEDIFKKKINMSDENFYDFKSIFSFVMPSKDNLFSNVETKNDTVLRILQKRFSNHNNFKTFGSEKFIAAPPWELSRASFVQPLYSSQSILRCLILSNMSLDNYYGIFDRDENDTLLDRSKNKTSNDKLNHYARNRIFFGAPGTGKSYLLNKQATAKDEAGFPEENIERVTFYPTYSYAQFVGTYKPVMRRKARHPLSADNLAILRVLQDKSLSLQEKYDRLYSAFNEHDQLTRLPIILGMCAKDGDALKTLKKEGTPTENNNYVEFNHGKAIQPFVQLIQEQNTEDRISYRYVPGPFIRMWLKAKQNPDQNYLLIIEELNRANAAAVFGDLFQLLDRKPDGESEYPVTTSEDLRDYLEEQGLEKDVTTIAIPPNLYIWTTMNSADQGVQPLDTAFKRRWDYTYLDINSNEEKIDGIKFTVDGKTYKWNDLRKEINRLLIAKKVNEDKLIGPFYLKPETLTSDNFVEQFCDKILMYLFEDAARQRRGFFDSEQLGSLPETYSSYCKVFEEHGPVIFKEIALEGSSEDEGDEQGTSADADRATTDEPEE